MLDFTWGDDAFPLRFTAADDGPVLASITTGVDAVEPRRPEQRARPALVEVLAVGEGRGLGSMRAIRTAIGDRLRHVEHRESAAGGRRVLTLVQRDERTGVVVTTRVERFDGVAAYRVASTLENRGSAPLLLQQVTSGTFIGLTGHLGDPEDLDLWTARSEWCAENRWSSTALSGTAGLADIDAALHGHFARGSIALTGHSTWPSGERVPVAVLEHRGTGRALAWEVEHNGPWRWELDTLFDPAEALALALLGPTDVDHAWLHRLEPGAAFATVPASIALADGGFAGAIGQLTEHRRRSHLDVHADTARSLVFNDYMNALMGDPTTEKLLPLIDAAASVGAEVFCIDAGWYDDGGDWWPSVGAWEPSTVRFGDLGLPGLLQVIRDRGMTPGLWVEPEVVGVRSPVAQSLPEDAFMHRAGVRIVEHDRYFLDLRSPAALAHLDAVFDRLIGEYGARYFKWDYNVTPGSGPDADAASPGDGLLGHARALLEWVEGLRARYPGVVLEACSSGAQRMDAATLARFDLQSTTDQQDARRYPTIAAGAPVAMAPEIAGNWAYPQSEWSDERIAFTLVTGLSGRLYLSGNLDRLDERQLDLVREATAAYPELIRHHALALPSWPLGLPAWDAPQVALATATSEQTLAFVWNREEGATSLVLAFPALRGRAVEAETVFPTALPAWSTSWDAEAGELTLDLTGAGESARVLRLR
ncbi:glycoside hydrolase family 36 protein [Amnibacterium setariae]|uniref:Alpha-galactosidase n=1 Tax=Amnibacterium setariae TaxID=2306585 RepID=A0A3A1U144_9MICO|nr:glycoside hydrolase family 36 protein [Amnibacterium setariae]RIX27537.1 alpha-galactosidase [Amnibacterium setariae]